MLAGSKGNSKCGNSFFRSLLNENTNFSVLSFMQCFVEEINFTKSLVQLGSRVVVSNIGDAEPLEEATEVGYRNV